MAEQSTGLSVAPYLTVSDGAGAIDFYVAAFGAVERMRMPAEDGRRLLHADLALNGGTIMLCDEFPEHDASCRSPNHVGGISVVIALGVPNVDAAFARAVAAGAIVAMPPADMFWGQRYAQVKDPFGHKWSFNGPSTAA